MKTLIKSLSLILALYLQSAGISYGVQLNALETEYLSDPLGLDTPSPRMSWRIQSDENGQKQTAYRIIVSSSKALAESGKGDLWDSGKVDSDQSFLVQYEGQALQKNDDGYWKVKVWDAHEKESEWSEVARFLIGPLQADDWAGKWIAHPSYKKNILQNQWFRKVIDLDENTRKSFIYICSMGYHNLYVNGRKVGDLPLAPSLTRLDKRVLYVTYDITSYLKTGKNKIDIQYNPGWARYEYFRTTPGLLADVYIETEGGTALSFATDKSWRTITGFEKRIGGIKYRDHGGESYDMNLADEKNRLLSSDSIEGWDTSAITVEKDVEISADLSNPNKVIQTLKPVAIDFNEECKIDMGINYTGMLEINFPAGSGDGEIIIKIADDAVGASYGKQPPGQDFGQRNSIQLRPDGSGLFKNTSNYVSGRYITLEGLKKPLRKEDVTVHVFTNGFEQEGSFTSSNPLFNKIYEVDLWTFIANTAEGFTMDCPHRERLGYGEVAYATAWGIGLPNYKAGAFYKKLLQDWCDVQSENGWVSHTAPQINKHFGGTMWSSAPVNLAYEYFKQYGDLATIENFYPTGVKWLEYLAEHLDDAGILQNYNTEHSGYFLGDWAAPGGRKEWGGTMEARFFNSCTFLMVTQKMTEMAKALNKTEDAERFSEIAAQLKTAIHKKFFNPDDATYMNGTQTQLAFALWQDVPPESVRDRVYQAFVDSMQAEPKVLDMGSSGLPVLLSYILEDAERADLLNPLLQKTDQPSYGYFLKRGETTWPEYWSVDVPSKIHTCYTGIASFFIRGIAGITALPEYPGMKRFAIRPSILKGLDHAKAERHSPYGTIQSEWKKSDDQLTLTVAIPVNTVAEVELPGLSNVTVNGRPLQEVAEVTVIRKLENTIILEVQSGKYRFYLKR